MSEEIKAGPGVYDVAKIEQALVWADHKKAAVVPAHILAAEVRDLRAKLAAAQRDLAVALKSWRDSSDRADALAEDVIRLNLVIGTMGAMLEDVGYSDGKVINALADLIQRHEELVPERDTAQAESFCAKKEASDLRAQNEKAESLLAAEREKVRVMRGIAMDLHQAFNCVVTIGVPVRKGRIYDSTWQEYGKALSTGAGEKS